MKQYIDKDALSAKIKKRYDEYISSILRHYDACKEAKAQELGKILTILDTLEVKEVDLEKEILNYIGDEASCKHGKWTWYECNKMIRHFFELGLSRNNPITAADRGTAEEIIINLKRVEQDYHIDLTKEMEWVRNQVKKGG